MRTIAPIPLSTLIATGGFRRPADVVTAMTAERDGLKGRVVLDSRGIKPEGDNAKVGSYGWYDQSIRDLVTLTRSKTKLALTIDDSPEMIPTNSASSVAIPASRVPPRYGSH